MRITIEIEQDGSPVTPAVVTSTSTAATTGTESEEVRDAGGFTAGGLTAAETSAAVGTDAGDAGGPPDWLVEEIAAAAAADPRSSGDQDAGSGPTQSPATAPTTSTAGPTTIREGADQ